MPIRPRCLITAFVNSNCIAFVASFQRTSTSSFTEPSSHLSPSRSVDLCSIYVHYCKSSIASCALVKTLFHWLSIIVQQSKSLLIGCCDSVHWSWTTPSEWHVICMVSLLSREPVYQKGDCSLIDIGTVYRVIASFPTQKSFGLLKASGSQINCSSSPRRKKPALESSENFDEISRKLKKPECFLLWLTRQRTFPTKKTFSVLRHVDSSKKH